MNLPVSSEWIVTATRQYITERVKTHPEIAAFVETLDALPLFVDSGGGVALRPDGELISFLWEEPQSIKVEMNPHLRFLAIVQGSQDYGELACVAPVRGADDRDCPFCEGSGRVPGLDESRVKNIGCYCGGAGWLPRNVPNPPRG